MTTIYSEITDGDTALAVVYRLTDSDGRLWRSSPYVLDDCLYWDEDALVPALAESNQRIRIPTLRHLMAGTVAEIELYIGNADLQVFQVYPNNPAVNYIDILPKEINGGTWLGTPNALRTIQEAVAYVGVGEKLYTTGGALENGPPPIARCACQWNNRVFVANGNNVYPSQEFSEGLGVAWNSNLRSRWEVGTGDILAMASINNDLLALFKADSVGIISGPGPDGMGQGNFVVYTLNSEAGCVNIKSILSGPDGVYYQDAKTGRLMLLGPDLQPKECAPGAFDASASEISCCLHVENARQLWFYAKSPTNRIIVIDYKHRTETSPFGSVYTWTTPNSWAVAGMAIIHSIPCLVLYDGSVSAQVVGQYGDTITYPNPMPNQFDYITATLPIYMAMYSGDMNPIGLQRQFDLTTVQFLGEWVSNHTLQVQVYADFGATPSTHTAAMTAGPEQLAMRPAYCMRIQAVRMHITETAATAGTPPATVIGAGFKFVGFALEVQDYGKIANLITTRIK